VNYRHAYHAGNFADVLKHALLVRLMRALHRKDRGLLLVDTHAGRGSYDLTQAAKGDTRARAPEWPEGIGRLWDRPDLPPAIADYVALVRAFDLARGNPGPGLRFYPGSPRLAGLVARPQDRLELWARHPEECAALRAEFAGGRRLAVHEADGYGALRACLPPPERRALVLIDPPFETADEWSRIAAALAEGRERFPSGTYAVWFPLTERSQAHLIEVMLHGVNSPTLVAELEIDPRARLRGCGVVMINPPWPFHSEAEGIVTFLAEALYRGAEAHGSVRWIVPE